MENKIKKISHFRKLSPVNLQFQDLTYTISQGRQEPKLILKSISGQFRSGQLCAILGSSGSGKTTLLNVLAGYKTDGADGTLLVNNRPIVFKEFRQLSRYIMQDNLLQSFLTVQESMSVTADLKLGREFSQEDKVLVISEILEILRLTSAKDTLSNNLSGGERKRLSIALELINNPPVIFLDEPTTGLDDLSSSQCVSLLKTLTEGGRTVICSIHTPSARIFEKFDNVYVMSEGMCAYQGYGRNVVSFLSNLGLSCPKRYNPADFVIEVSSGQYGDQYVEKMYQEMENGRNCSYFKNNCQEIEISNAGDSPKINLASVNHRHECFRQFKILLYRRWLQISRNKQYLLLKIVVSILIGFTLGCFFFDLGQNAWKMRFNASFCFTSLTTFLYLTIMPICLNFPSEIKLIQREYFNKWYGLTAYYLAMTVATLPVHVIMVFLCISISYTMSAQPMELDRFILVTLICSLVTLVADSHGLIVASIFNVTNGSFAGPVTIMPFLLVAVFGIGEYTSLSSLVKIAMYCSYVRYAYEGFLLAIFGNGRSFLECPEEKIMCPFKDPKKFIEFVGLQNTFIWIDIAGLIVWFFIFRIVGFYLLWIRLQANHPLRSVKFLVQNLYRKKF